MRQIALLRFYYKSDPEKWSDEKFYRMVAELDYCLLKTGVLTENE
jgi:hypothetical protein